MKVLHRFFTRSSLLFLAIAGATMFITKLSAQSAYSLTPLWSLAPEIPYDWASTNNHQRGLAFNPVTGNLLTVSRFPGTNAAVYILNGNTGTHTGNLNVNGIFSEINFPLNMIGVADDGIIYACNLTLDSTNAPTGNNGPFRIYRWESESSAPTVAYLGDPSNEDTILNNRRFGDSFAVRGSGLNTEILAGTRSGKIVARFVTSDGLNFTHQKISAPDLVGAVTVTISFGTNNTFWVKAESTVNTNYPLQQFSYNINDSTGTLMEMHTNSPVVGGPLAFNPDRNLLGIIRARSHELHLFKLTDYGFVQQVAAQSFSTTNNNGNFTGSVVFTANRLFALESNNGILAFEITTNSLSGFTVSATANSEDVTLTWPSKTGFIYQPQFKSTLSETWANLQAPTNGTDANIILTNPKGLDATRFYRVVAQ